MGLVRAREEYRRDTWAASYCRCSTPCMLGDGNASAWVRMHGRLLPLVWVELQLVLATEWWW